jgi:hypothetical protein
MKIWTALVSLSVLVVCMLAQQSSRPQLKLRIVVDKEVYALHERVMVKSELTNLTSKTLCFPVPDQDCETTRTGWVVTEGEPVKAGNERDLFICHTDGSSASGVELEQEIKNRWIKLPPNGVYVTKSAEAKASLKQVGDWRLRASYHPPVGAFSRDYAKVLQSAVGSIGCKVPDSTALAEPRIITILPASPTDR